MFAINYILYSHEIPLSNEIFVNKSVANSENPRGTLGVPGVSVLSV